MGDRGHPATEGAICLGNGDLYLFSFVYPQETRAQGLGVLDRDSVSDLGLTFWIETTAATLCGKLS